MAQDTPYNYLTSNTPCTDESTPTVTVGHPSRVTTMILRMVLVPSGSKVGTTPTLQTRRPPVGRPEDP